MKISKTEEHALRLVMRLARLGAQATLTELSELEGMPEPTVAKLLGKLRRGGVVVAQRGRNGGYELARPAAEIDVASVIVALGKPLLDGSDCTPGRPAETDCPNAADCGLRPVWRHLERRISGVLTATTLADLIRAERDVVIHLDRLWPRRSPVGESSPDHAGIQEECS